VEAVGFEIITSSEGNLWALTFEACWLCGLSLSAFKTGLFKSVLALAILRGVGVKGSVGFDLRD
jgi:hypothetical protein